MMRLSKSDVWSFLEDQRRKKHIDKIPENIKSSLNINKEEIINLMNKLVLLQFFKNANLLQYIKEFYI